MTTWTVTKGILLAAGIGWVLVCAVRAFRPADASAASPYRTMGDAQQITARLSDRATHRHVKVGRMFWIAGCQNRVMYYRCTSVGSNLHRTVQCAWRGITVPLPKARRPQGPTSGGCLVAPRGIRTASALSLLSLS